MKLSTQGRLARAARTAFAVGLAAAVVPTFAQEAAPAADGDKAVQLEAVKVTGTRVVIPGAVSSSPIVTVRAAEFSKQQTVEAEQVLRNLPSTLASDGSAANNGTAGASTLDLRGLGAQRGLILVDGKRLTPYDINGIVDLSTVPTALLDRVDLVTGGASAVYGSDAMSGAVNFVMKRNFQGVDINYINGITEEGDGDKSALQLAMGTNLAGGKGNVAMALTYGHRDGVQFGQRPLGQLGIVTEDGAGFANFQAGMGPQAAPAGCGGTGTVAVGGSPSTLPTRIGITGATPAANTAQADPRTEAAGGTATSNGGQFREDGTLGPNCNVFNFNPFNYYETPQKRYGGAVFGHFEFNKHAEAYSRFIYNNTEVRQQIAPSGIFGTAFFVPLSNPYLSTQARDLLIAQANNARITDSNAAMAGVQSGLPAASWRDKNNDGMVDAGDELRLNIRRRTPEFGERSTTFRNNAYQFAVGSRGNIIGDWDYDVSLQRGQSDQVRLNEGYTNLTNVTNAVRGGRDGAGNIVCVNPDGSTIPGCVPLNLFGREGLITPDQAAYSTATGIEVRTYEQNIATATVNGTFNFSRPLATRPIGVSFGVERRREEGETTPDECLKTPPVSCLGGAGGNTLPIAGGFGVNEFFTEAIVPLVDGQAAAKSLDLEVGYRWSDYNTTGLNRTWKYGLSWVPTEGVLARIMRQRAARAPNVGELASPVTTGLDNANFDPCSAGNPDLDGNGVLDKDEPGTQAPSAALVTRCEQTGVGAGLTGTIADIAAGQVNIFSGSDPNNPPEPESADTTTLGVVFKPKNFGIVRNPYLSLDYYDIKINKYIGSFGAQEILDQCYINGSASECAKIVRVDSELGADGAGINLFTTNLSFLRAEGLEMVGAFDVFAGAVGKFRFNLNANYYLTQESQSSPSNDVIDCKGRFGTQCGNPLPELRFTQRTTWEYKNFDVSYLWRHIGNARVETAQEANVFSEFQKIDAFNYVDLSVGYNFGKKLRLNLLATNVFDKDPPVVGNEAADTRSNSGNTFPSVYDVLGRTFSLNVGMTF